MELKKIMGKAVLLCAVAFAAVACGQDEFDEPVGPVSGKATLRLSAVGFTGETRLTRAAAKTGESAINGVWVAQFDANGKILKGPNYYSSIGANNTVEAELDTENSNVYAVANVASDLFDTFDLKNGTEAQFKAATVKYTSEITCDGSSHFLPMVGVKAVSATDTQINVTLKRAVARIDFTVTHDVVSTATCTNLKLTECYLTYVPNTSIVEEKEAGSARVYPAAAAAQFYGNDAADDKSKYVYGKKAINLTAQGQSDVVTWYVPENLAGEGSASVITAPKDKGEKTAPDKFAMRIVVKGICEYKGTPNTEVSFTIFPGQNATTSFNVQRNYVYTVSSTIKGLNVTDNRVTVHDFVDLSADGTANCYMIHQAGKYKFKYTVPGNGDIYRSGTTLIDNTFSKTTLTGTAAEILWQGNGASYATGNGTTSVIKNVAIDGDYITFETADTFAEGNALIALKNGSTTEWSWHIWATVYDPENANDTYTISNARTVPSTEVMMRCNLGATGQGATGYAAELTAPQCYGLTYQWGRKDPFYGTNTDTAPTVGNFTSNGEMLNLSIANPTTFYKNANTTTYDWYANAAANQNNYLWGNPINGTNSVSVIHGTSTTTRILNKDRGKKTAFDPCPVGWRVSPQDMWYGRVTATSQYTAKSGNTPAYLSVSSGITPTRTVRLPAAGYLHRDTGAVTVVGTEGGYWSSSPYSTEVYAGGLYFHSGGVYPVCNNYRAGGFSVRCVRE